MDNNFTNSSSKHAKDLKKIEKKQERLAKKEVKLDNKEEKLRMSGASIKRQERFAKRKEAFNRKKEGLALQEENLLDVEDIDDNAESDTEEEKKPEESADSTSTEDTVEVQDDVTPEETTEEVTEEVSEEDIKSDAVNLKKDLRDYIKAVHEAKKISKKKDRVAKKQQKVQDKEDKLNESSKNTDKKQARINKKKAKLNKAVEVLNEKEGTNMNALNSLSEIGREYNQKYFDHQVNNIAIEVCNMKHKIYNSEQEYIDRANDYARKRLETVPDLFSIGKNVDSIHFTTVQEIDDFINGIIPKIKPYYVNEDLKIKGQESDSKSDDDIPDDVAVTSNDPEPAQTEGFKDNKSDNLDDTLAAITFDNLIEGAEEQPKRTMDSESAKVANLVSKFVKDAEVFASKTKYTNGGNVGTFDVEISDINGKRCYVIDNGSIIPNSLSVISYTNDGYTIAVPLVKKQRDLLRNIFGHGYYVTEQEAADLRHKYYLKDIAIYNNIDFTGMSRIIGMSDADKAALSERLKFICDNTMKAINLNARFRFSKFESIDDFELVSDDKCVTPIPGAMVPTTICYKRATFKDNKVQLFELDKDSTTTSNAPQMEVKDQRAA